MDDSAREKEKKSKNTAFGGLKNLFSRTIDTAEPFRFSPYV